MLEVIRHEDMICVCGHPRRAHRAAGCSAAEAKTQHPDNNLREERCGCRKFQLAGVPAKSDWIRTGEGSRQ